MGDRILAWRFISAIVLVGWLGVAQSFAGPFSSLVVFGDSLSDVGNIAQATGGVFPGSAYSNNRFSNGPVWIESLSNDLGLGSIQRSTAGGNNFAYGGAQTTGTGGIFGFFIRDVDEQVTQFLNTRTVDPSALFVVYAGANDLFSGQTNVNVPVGSLASDIGRLVAAGARQFLVPNLPPLGFTPSYNASPTLKAQFNARSEQFNAALNVALDNLSASNLELMFYRLDVADLFLDALADPAGFGLTNVTNPAAPGLEPGMASYNTAQIVPNANEYMFWDEVHPTATVHAILAERARMLLEGLPGDYNEDGTVDAADYTVWRDRVGGTSSLPNDDTAGVDVDDYERWKLNFGELSGGASVDLAHVPEQTTGGLVLIALVLGWSMAKYRT